MVNRAIHRFADDELFRIRIAMVVGFLTNFNIDEHHVQTSFLD